MQLHPHYTLLWRSECENAVAFNQELGSVLEQDHRITSGLEGISILDIASLARNHRTKRRLGAAHFLDVIFLGTAFIALPGGGHRSVAGAESRTEAVSVGAWLVLADHIIAAGPASLRAAAATEAARESKEIRTAYDAVVVNGVGPCGAHDLGQAVDGYPTGLSACGCGRQPARIC